MTELLNIICVVYLNNILIYITDKNLKTHWKAVRKVLIWLQKFKLFINIKKCKFMTIEVEFLEFIMNTENIFINLRRITMINEWLKPINIKDIQMFLDFTNFYRRFIANYFYVTALLMNCLHKTKKKKKRNWLSWY